MQARKPTKAEIKVKEKFASVREYARKRGVSPKLIYTLVEDPSSGFPCLRFNSRIVIDVEAADRWARTQADARSNQQAK